MGRISFFEEIPQDIESFGMKTASKLRTVQESFINKRQLFFN
jgi:hypothetical protein